MKGILENPIYCGDLIWGRGTRFEAGAPVDLTLPELTGGASDNASDEPAAAGRFVEVSFMTAVAR